MLPFGSRATITLISFSKSTVRSKNEFIAGPSRPDIVQFPGGDGLLAFAIVTEGGRLEDGGASDQFHGRLEFGPILHGAKLRNRKTVFGKERLLAQPMLRDLQNISVRPDIAMKGAPADGFRRNIFKLKRDQIDLTGKAPHGIFVEVIGLRRRIGELRRRPVFFRRKNMDPVTHRRAAMANIRPSWPPPMTPIVEPGR